MMPGKAATYQQFLEQVSGSPTLNMPDERELIIQRFMSPKKTIARFAPVTFLLDYSTRKYIYVDETCIDLLGYTASYFLETGLDEYLAKWHPLDYQVINEKIFPDNFIFLETVSPDRYGDYIFSHNYRIMNAIGKYINVVQRYSFLYNSSVGKPTGLIGIVFDITHFKTDQNIVHTIEQCVGYNGTTVNKLISKKIHPVYEVAVQQLISKRELVVLQCMAEGLSSKRIADKLRLSINTVNNHRKNMLHRTNSRSTGELISHAIKYGLL
jgi:DNA-binding CsgD family transcriptional regulator